MKILVCGGRRNKDRKTIFGFLDDLHSRIPVTELIHGNALGVDRIAGDWAHAHGIPVRVFPADWDKHGKAAGPIRNAQMLREGRPDKVFAFDGGVGTENMVAQAEATGVPVTRAYVVEE